MSQQNVEIVTRFFDRIVRNLDAYWDASGSYADAVERGASDPDAQAVLDQLDPDIRLVDVLGRVREGGLGFAQFVDELRQLVQSYSLEIVEVSDLGEDHVLAVLQVSMKGVRSGATGAMLLHILIALRDGLLADYVEYAERGEALDAVGLAE
jgi:ketosteroid isomerase-like protein